MAINFPNSPSVNDIHSEGGVRWKWNGSSWTRASGAAVTDTLTTVNDNSTTTLYPVFTSGTGSQTPKVATTATKNISFNASDGNLTVGGNVSVGGTLTYEDVKNVDSIGIITARAGVYLPADDKYIKIGASNDLSFVHTSGSSYITNSTGHLVRRSDVHKWEKYDGSSEYARFTSDGQALVGTTSNRAINAHAPRVQISGTNYSTSTVSLVNNAADATGAYLFFTKQRSGSAGGSTAVAQDDIIGDIRFTAGDGTDVETGAARITVVAESNAGSNSVPSYMRFSTTSTTTPVERLRITSGGHVRLPNDSQQLQIGASQDIQIFHNGTDSVIYNATGNLDLRSNGTIELQASDGSEMYAKFIRDLGVELYYNNSKKIETTDTGATVTGAINLTGASSGNYLNVGSSTVYANAAINIYRLGNGYADMRLSSNYGAKIALAGASNNTDEFYIQQDNGKTAYIYNEANKGITFGTNNTARMWLDNNGNFKVVGISTFNSSVHVSGDLDVAADIRHIGDTDTRLRFETDTISVRTAGSERLRITGDGPHLLLGGTSDVNEITESSANAGMVIGGTGFGNAGLAIITSTTGAGRLYFGDGVTNSANRNRGQINYYHSSDYMMFATAGTERLRINSSGHVVPGADSTYDLGLTGTRFRNFYADTLYGDGSNLTGISAGVSTEFVHAQTLAVVGITTLTGSVGFGNTVGLKKNQKLYLNVDANNSFGDAFIYGDDYNIIVQNSNQAGSAYFRGNTCNLQGGGSYKTGIRVSGSQGDVEFFHNNSIIGETHSTGEGGIDIKQSLRHYGDLDTLIEFETNQINFDTAGSERLRIQSDGNITHTGGRIFTSRASGEAGILIGSGNAGGATVYLDGDSNGDWSGGDYAYIRHNTSGDLEIHSTNPNDDGEIYFSVGAGAEKVRITSSGNIQLQGGTIYGDDSALPTFTIANTSGNSNNCKINLGENVGSDNGGIAFYTAGSSSSDLKMRIRGNNDFIDIIDDNRLRFHDGKLYIYHNGSNGYVVNGTGQLLHRSATHTFENAAGSTEYLRINSSGIKVTGDADISGNLYFDSDTDTHISNANTANWIRFTSASITVMDITDSHNLKLHDNRKLWIGASNDIQIYHASSNSTSYYYHPQNNVNQSFNVAASWTLETTAAEKRIRCPGSGTSPRVELYYNGTEVMQTSTTGIDLVANKDLKLQTTGKITFGAGNATIKHTGTHWYFASNSGDCYWDSTSHHIFRVADNENSVVCNANAGVDLYHNNSKKFGTTSSGIRVWTQWDSSAGIYVDVGSAQNGTAKVATFQTSHYGGERGSIGLTLSGTSYNTSSDYRMKENVVSLTGATSRIKNLLPKRFNFKEDDKTIDGFLAHEVSSVVPEAVTGEKDATEMQQLDYSKLATLTIAALQEAIAKIETLEAEVAALKSA